MRPVHAPKVTLSRAIIRPVLIAAAAGALLIFAAAASVVPSTNTGEPSEIENDTHMMLVGDLNSDSDVDLITGTAGRIAGADAEDLGDRVFFSSLRQ